jgi:ABC-2 type transport system ATP-binding protein
MENLSIETINLCKKYDARVVVDDLNLKIPSGKIFGFLGPNGAGKSTTINMLSTVLTPTSGTAIINGFDLIKERKKIREIIGVCPQELVLYELMTARENIYLIAQMHNIHPRDYKERTDELLGQMQLLDRADDKLNSFSGGMKRRINVLMAVIHDPDIIFLDEPGAGLDPQSRRVVWDFIKDFEKKRKTVILTTHNMEEADDLSSKLAIIDHGKIIAEGTSRELKGRIGGGDVIEFKLPEEKSDLRDKVIASLKANRDVLWAQPLGKELISFSSLDGLRKISTFYNQIFNEFSVSMQDVQIRQNSLEDVFIELTGRKLRE